jgi:hypothetical protein
MFTNILARLYPGIRLDGVPLVVNISEATLPWLVIGFRLLILLLPRLCNVGSIL